MSAPDWADAYAESARDYAADCELVADAFGVLDYLDPKICPSEVPIGWGEQVPRIVVGNATIGTVLVTLDRDGWRISGGGDPHSRVVSGEYLAEAVAAMLRGERADSLPRAFSDWTGERRS